MPNESANPLLLGWIKEWYDVAKERSSKGATVYKKAYESMKACPLTFNHPSEAQQLHGLGPKLCDRLTERLNQHCAENGLPMPKIRRKARKRSIDDKIAEDTDGLTPVKKPRKAKLYVPTLRSGAYALLIALSSVPEGSDQGLPKNEAIRLAEGYCDSSFTAPSDPTKFYTAWNSIKTLETKDLVYIKGRPLKKYVLTEEGWEVAKRVRKTLEDDGQRPKEAESLANARPQKRNSDQFLDLDDEPEEVISTALQGRSPAAENGGQRTTTTTSKSGQRLGEAPIDKYGTFASPRKHKNTTDFDFLELESSPAPQPAPSFARPHHSSTRETEIPAKFPNKEAAAGIAAFAERESESRTTRPVFPSFQPIRLSPGTFTVRLVLDNREVRAKNDRDYIQDELTKKGVKPIVRPLELGDAFWVAKCNDPNLLARYGEEGDEVVLDWIVERKRLDDLVGSIKDGRFHEQKFRLRKSGVKNVVYIIEEISMSQEIASKYHEAMQSAIASTQVVNGYFVKKTQKLDDTIRYLARMTTMLKSIYEAKPLHIIPTAHLTPETYLPLLAHLRTHAPQKSHNITYPAFSSLSSKSDSLTLRDIFLKMLMCTRGITGDKALEVQKLWGTPRAFVEALEACSEERERRELVFGKLGQAVVGRRRVGRALSAKVAEVWGEG